MTRMKSLTVLFDAAPAGLENFYCVQAVSATISFVDAPEIARIGRVEIQELERRAVRAR